MKPVKQYITETILDDDDELLTNFRVGDDVKDFIRENYYIIVHNGDKVIPLNDIKLDFEDNIFIVTLSNIKSTDKIVFKHLQNTLTNGKFCWGDLNCDFDCGTDQKNPHKGHLNNLIGSPHKCINYTANGLDIVSLQGAPKECIKFDISDCKKLKTLQYAPDSVHEIDVSGTNIGNFIGCPQKCAVVSAFSCMNLKSLQGLPNTLYELTINHCKNVTSFRGGPKICNIVSVKHCTGLTGASYFPKGCETLYYVGSELNPSEFKDKVQNIIG